jgi:hypothetical protein
MYESQYRRDTVTEVVISPTSTEVTEIANGITKDPGG